MFPIYIIKNLKNERALPDIAVAEKRKCPFGASPNKFIIVPMDIPNEYH